MHSRGKIFNIQRFSTADGPGIRTVVFFKGCPLDCAWCHNPESKSMELEIFYKQDLCIGCGACLTSCPNSAHVFKDGIHIFQRDICKKCGNCIAACSTKALEYCGEEKSLEEIFRIIQRDIPFYEESGEGVTLSGGEPLLQFDFTLALLKLCKQHQLHTAIETSGFCNKDITLLHAYTDLWLYDIKVFPTTQHQQFTGVENTVIFDNLHHLGRSGAQIILRCPVIPKVNLTAEHFDQLAELANQYENIREIHLEPYHPLGITKAQNLGKDQSYPNETFLESSTLEPFANMLRSKTNKSVIIL